jgi:glycosyltransferase involved in cell wall biosynthesis
MASTDAQPWRLGFLSRLSAAKGLDLVVEAFIRLLVQHPTPPVSLAVAGEARGREVRTVARLRQRLREAGLHRQVEWCGKVDQDAKLTFLQGCTLFTIASRVPERRAIAGLEAMACGVPIVAPAQGILRELVEGTGGGVLVRPEDPEELASAWAHLLADAARRARLGAAARAGAERSYSLPVAAAAFEAVAAELQAASGPAR